MCDAVVAHEFGELPPFAHVFPELCVLRRSAKRVKKRGLFDALGCAP